VANAAQPAPGRAKTPGRPSVTHKFATPHRAAQGLWALAALVGRRYGLPPGLLQAVVWSESRWQPTAMGANRNGSCDVGLGQVNVPGCDPLRVAELVNPDVNLRAAASILRASARACTQQPGRVGCSVCPWGRYNPHSLGWCARVEARRSRTINRFVHRR